MGTIILRDRSKIHDPKVRLENGGTTYTAYAGSGLKTTQHISSGGSYNAEGCCTHTINKKTQGTEEYNIIKYNLNTFPTLYRDLKYIKKWINFINETFPFADVKILHHDGVNLLDTDYWTSKNITFDFNKTGNVYFSMKKVIGNGLYRNLFVMSLIRALANNEYYFMVYDTLRLRKLKSLADLSNWDIINIAKYGMQCNDVMHKNGSWQDSYAFLRDYRFPLSLTYAHFQAETFDGMVRKLESGHNQNTSCTSGKYLLINPIYAMKLFQDKKYRKLHDMVTDPKHVVKNTTEAINEFRALVSSYGSAKFNSMNNQKIDFKEYGKTIQAR